MPATDLVVKIAGDASELQSTLAGLGQSLLESLAGVHPAAAAAVTAVAAIGGAAIAIADDFETANNRIVTSTGAQGERLQQLKSDWEAVFVNVPQSADEVATALSEVHARTGLMGEPLQTLTNNLIDLADFAGENLSTTVGNVTRVFGDWGTATADQNSTMDYLFRTTQETGIGIGELTTQLVTFGAPLRQMGFDMETSAALLGKFEEEGVNAELVMGSLRIALTRMAEAGITDTRAALDSLTEGIKNAGSTGEANRLAIELFGAKAGPDMAAAIREGRFEVGELVTTLQNGTMTIADAGSQTETLGEKFTALYRHTAVLLEPLGTGLVDAAKDVLDTFLDLFEPTSGVGEAFDAVLEFAKPLVDLWKDHLAPVAETIGTLLVGLGLTIGKALVPVVKTAWEIFRDFGTLLRNVLVTVIGTVSDKINQFLGLLRELPGVSSLMTTGQNAINAALGTTATKAGEAKTATDQLKTASGTLASDLETKTKPAVGNFAGALSSAKDKQDALKDATNLLKSSQEAYVNLLEQSVTPKVRSLSEATIDLQRAKEFAKTSADNLKAAQDNLKAKLTDTTTSATDLKTAMEGLERAKAMAKTAADRLKSSTDELKDAQGRAKVEAKALDDEFEALNRSMQTAKSTAGVDVAQAMETLNGIIGELNLNLGDTAQNKALEAQSALKRLGVTTKEELADLATKAEENFRIVKNSGTSSATEVQQAWVAMLEARKAALQANGEQLSSEEARILGDLKTKLEQHKTGTTTTWTQMNEDIRRSVTDLSTSMVQSLFEGDFSFKEKGLQALRGLGEAVATHFITPATKAISDFIANTLTDLLSGKGLGGVMDSLKNIGSAMAGIFGKGSGAATGTAGGIASGVSSAGNSAASASSGADMFGAAGSIGTMISSIISNFQLAKQETSLNAIEHNTRYTMMYLGERADGGILGVMFKMADELAYGNLTKAVERIRDQQWDYTVPRLTDINTTLGQIKTSIEWLQGSIDRIADQFFSATMSLDAISSSMRNVEMVNRNMEFALNQLSHTPPPNVNVQCYLDSTPVAARVMQQVEMSIRRF